MIKIDYMILKTGQILTHEFDDVYEAKKFLLRCRYSKKVRVVGVECLLQDDFEFLQWYC